MFVIEIKPGQEVIETVAAELASRGVRRGAIVSLIGAVDRCCLSNMSKHDAKSDILHEYQQPFEITGTGEVKDGNPHIHCILGAEGDASLAGHLHWARVENWFVNIYVLEMDG